MNKPSGKLLAASLLALFAACSGSDPVEDARFLIARGELDQAEQMLAEVQTSRADVVRSEIEAARAERADVERRIEVEIARAADGELLEAKKALRALSAELEDFGARERVDTVLSRLSDLAAEFRSKKSIARAEDDGGGTVPHPLYENEREDRAQRIHEEALVDEMVVRLVGYVKDAIEARDWTRASSLFDMAVGHAGDHVATLEDLRTELVAEASSEIDELLVEAEKLEAERGVGAAYNLLARNSSRFPWSGPLARYHERMEDLQGRHFASDFTSTREQGESVAVIDPPARDVRRSRPRLEPRTPRVAPRPEKATPTPVEPEPESNAGAIAILTAAREKEATEDVLVAYEAWLEAASELPAGDEREYALHHAQDLQARLALRAELRVTWREYEGLFSALGIDEVREDACVMSGEDVAWNDVELETLERVVLLAGLSTQGQIGWIQERVARGDKDGLLEIAALLARDEIEPDQAWSIIATARNESLPSDGYLFEKGKWIDRAAHEAELLAKQLATLQKNLRNAGKKKRDAALDELVAVGYVAEDALRETLEERWTSALTKIERGATLEQLVRLAEQRTELDEKRVTALALIFDEEEYFYPYRPPECPPDKARLYHEVQRRVDELVTTVRLVWEAPGSVKLPKAFRESLEELEWNRARQLELEYAFEVPKELPAWLPSIDSSRELLTLRDFAWSEEERAARIYDRSVVAFNEHSFAEYAPEKGDEGSLPDESEKEQVRITNEYRMMLGRRALAWNPTIMTAAQAHTDWMSKTGKFSHFNDEDPARLTPGDRMRLAGYNFGVSENLHMGGSGPRGAHDGWRGSSGHHRNLLMSSHREMASATGGRYWTQNFGGGREFLEQLKEWYD